MRRTFIRVCLMMAFAATPGLAQTQRPRFEVASIRPSQPDIQGAIQRSGTRLVFTGYTPRMLILWAFDIREDRLIARSKWLDAVRYDVVAQAPAEPRRGELQLMTQSLLADRFGLVFHREQRTQSFFALIVDSAGAKLKISAAPPGPANNTFGVTQLGHLRGTNVTAAMLANVLSNQTGRSVQDFTGLAGIFDFTLEWAPDATSQDDSVAALPSLFTALREQLGLKLESRKGPVDVVVVDRIESAPSAN